MLLFALRHVGRLAPSRIGARCRLARPLFSDIKLSATASAVAAAAAGAGAALAFAAPLDDEAAQINQAYQAKLIPLELWLSELQRIEKEKDAAAEEQAALEEQAQLSNLSVAPATASAGRRITFSMRMISMLMGID